MAHLFFLPEETYSFEVASLLADYFAGWPLLWALLACFRQDRFLQAL